MASTYLTRTQTAGNRRKGTFSAWFKKVNLTYQYLMSWNSTTSGTSLGDWIRFNGEQLDILKYTGSVVYRLQTNRLFRDTSAWYHLVVAYDSEQATASNRIKIYVNGVQETSFNESTYPSQNFDFQFNNNNIVACVGKNYNTEANFDGLMSHVHFIDGTAYDATAFGEYDANGVWKIKTSPSVTYGTNGFFILKDSASVTDQSGNGNNFTVGGGTLTDTLDCPANVFATLNTLTLSASQLNIVYGNNKKSNTPTSNSWRSIVSTLGTSTGKYYFEVRVDNREETDLNNFAVGITDYEQSDDQTATNGKFFAFSRGYGYHAKNGDKLNNDSVTANGVAYGDSWTTNDIIGCAFDLDNGKLYFSKNGVWQNSGDPTSGATGTGSAFDIATGYTYFPVMAQYYGNEHYSFNFGNGVFGNGTVSSAGTNASGNGIFEYDVPTGYTALSTKGLNL